MTTTLRPKRRTDSGNGSVQAYGDSSGVGRGPQVVSKTDSKETLCGPLLNYKRMSDTATKTPLWHGSVLLVTTPGQRAPQLQLRSLGPVRSRGNATMAATNGNLDGNKARSRTFGGEKLYEDR